MPNRTLIVGDVHGCLNELEQLLEVAQLTPNDRLVFAGDLTAKGPDSAGVVRRVRSLHALSVLGNHDAAVLGAAKGKPAGHHHRDVARSLSDDDVRFLDLLPLWLDFPELNTLVVHGGLMPHVDLSAQKKEVLLNLRSIDADGQPKFRAAEGVPWASLWPGPRFVVFGHDAIRGLQTHPHALGLDTGCVYGKRLSAVWLPERRVISVPAQRVWKKPESEEPLDGPRHR